MTFKFIDKLALTENRELRTENCDYLGSHLAVPILIACGLMFYGFIASASEVAPPSQHEEASLSTNMVTSPEGSGASSQETKSTSSPSNVPDETKIVNDDKATNSDSSNSETNTNGVKDSSMMPPASAPSDNPTSAPLPMDPNEGNVNEVQEENLSPVNNTESIEKKKHEIKVRYNEVRTQVEKEEAVAALRQAADKSATPEGERQTLKAYYELLFKRMKQIDSSLTERCDVMQGAYLRRVEQTAIEPTIPLHLPAGVEKNSVNPTQKKDLTTKEKPHQKKSTL